MRNGSIVIVLLLGAAALGCQPPMAIGKVRSEPTDDFPVAWGDTSSESEQTVLAGTTSPATKAAEPAGSVPEELVPRSGAVARRDAIAVVVGVERYRVDLPAATGAERDAKLFAAYAEKTLGLKRSNVRLLVGTDATRSSIDAVLDEWLAKNASAEGELFFYFAGHGAPEPETSRGYLVPWDADPKYIKSQGIAFDDLVGRLAKVKAKRTFAFVVACFSGAGGRSVLAEGTRPLVRIKGLESSVGGVTLLTAAGPDETTGAAGSGHGLFTHHLLMGLNGKADADADGAITMSEVARYATAKVKDDAARDNREQEPRMLGEGGDVVLTRLPPAH